MCLIFDYAKIFIIKVELVNQPDTKIFYYSSFYSVFLIMLRNKTPLVLKQLCPLLCGTLGCTPLYSVGVIKSVTLMLLPCGLTSFYLAVAKHRYIPTLTASLLVGVS